jgi:hypothetical protein
MPTVLSRIASTADTRSATLMVFQYLLSERAASSGFVHW